MPVADLFSLNLVIGNLFSRLSFRQEFHIVTSTAQPLPFSFFFDLDHYRAAAQANHTQIHQLVEQTEVDDSCGPQYLPSNTLLVPKRFWPFTRDQLFELLLTNNVSLPRPAGSVLRLGQDLLTTYQFRGSHANKIYAQQQFESLARLNASLAFVVDAIEQQLPSGYLAVHVRLEHDVVAVREAERNYTNFNLLIHEYLDLVDAAFAKGLGDPHGHGQRVVYMSTGLFHDYNLEQHLNSSGHFRPNAVVRMFTAAGYTPLWSDRVLSLPTPTATPQQTSRLSKAKELFGALGAEQKALVDLFVCKKAGGFIGARKGSSFSYLIWRWREYELRIPEAQMNAIMAKEPSRGFSSWGVRRRKF